MSQENVERVAASILNLASEAGCGMVVVGIIMRRLLEAGRPVSPKQIVGDLDLSIEKVTAVLGQIGAKLDDDGNILGLSLSLLPTPHRYLVHGRVFYAWCATDAIVFPSLFGHTASIDSPDPTNATRIRLNVSPEP